MDNSTNQCAVERAILDIFSHLRKIATGRGPSKKRCSIDGKYLTVELIDSFPLFADFFLQQGHIQFLYLFENQLAKCLEPKLKFFFRRFLDTEISDLLVSIDPIDRRVIITAVGSRNWREVSLAPEFNKINTDQLVKKYF